ncbi:methylphosphotriester-DNA--protein-cysteine methyltransferase [Pedobacter cryoconitis]|uniref:Methylphosphotriester-DNA--protein-cysteine methyltransferase n=1 Tax=Pedobacter cryoconitis TaxID=188932 RepID=A0A7W8ZM10_9SPHI|nr:Ada metal-binding domain-containing protein [Pedobacter cryoconitis]MBB5636484.1 methylphosphotriester-DNA--protein-cysteine methyltransferase [Pedobacter cryoconitis]
MIRHILTSDQDLRKLIRKGIITIGGNEKLKIYGCLNCKSGKRMKRVNRVFFTDEKEAVSNGFRPCGNCKRNLYKEWIYSVQKSL